MGAESLHEDAVSRGRWLGERSTVPGAASSNKWVEGGPMKDMEKSPSDGKQETVKGQGKKRWVSNRRGGSATSRSAGGSRQNIFTTNQRWLCKLYPAINFLVLSLFITPTNLVRIYFRIADKIEASRIRGPFEL